MVGWSLVFLRILSGCGGSEPSATPAGSAVSPVGFSLAFSSRVDGEIEPCG
jgi:hypothetical protein